MARNVAAPLFWISAMIGRCACNQTCGAASFATRVS